MRLRLATMSALFLASSAFGQVPEVLLQQGAPFNGAAPGEVVQALQHIEVTEGGAYSVSGTSSNGGSPQGLVFGSFSGGDAGVLRRPQTLGNYQQTTIGLHVGIGNGTVAYDCEVIDLVGGGTFDAVFLGDTPLSVEGTPILGLPGAVWSYRFSGLVHMTDTGTPYWRQRFDDSSSAFGIFEGTQANLLLKSFDVIPGFQNDVDFLITVRSQWWKSSAGAHDIAVLFLDSDHGVLLDGAPAPMGSEILEEGRTLPPAQGGINGEFWTGFTGAAVNESGTWIVNGTALGSSFQGVQVVNGTVTHRKGDTLDGVVLELENGFVRMNDDGDRVFFWELENNPGGLFLNDDLMLQIGDAVDLDGDGFSDEDATIFSTNTFTNDYRHAKFDLTGRSANDTVDVYAAVTLDVAGQPADALVRIRRNVGDLRLDARPSWVEAGDPVTLRLRGGLPGSPLFWITASVNGAPRFTKLAKTTLDANGVAELVGVVPNGLGTLNVEVVALGFDTNGKVGLSNRTPLSLR